MDWSGMSNKAVLEVLGERIRRQRLNRNITQNRLGEVAGVARSVVQKVERGDGCTLESFVKILRALDATDGLDFLLPDPGISPVQLARLHARKRQRASGSRGGKTGDGPGEGR
jgi:putative transcriptional regulator